MPIKAIVLTEDPLLKAQSVGEIVRSYNNSFKTLAVDGLQIIAKDTKDRDMGEPITVPYAIRTSQDDEGHEIKTWYISKDNALETFTKQEDFEKAIKQLEDEIAEIEGEYATQEAVDELGKSLTELINKEVEGLETHLEEKQDNLVSGENIKTINGMSILGAGDIQIVEDAHYEITIDAGFSWIKTESESGVSYYCDIAHNLNKSPAVTVVEIFGSHEYERIVGVEYIDNNHVRITINDSNVFNGKVYCN